MASQSPHSNDRRPSSNEDLYKKAKNTISAASRLLRRKIPQSGHLMTSKRLWMQSIPDENVDVVIVFPPDISEATAIAVAILDRIQCIDGIIVQKKAIAITKGTKTKPNCLAFHLSATYHGYLRGLEMMQVPKLLRADLGGGWKEFTIKEKDSFEGVTDMDVFLTSQERQSILLHLLNSVRAEKSMVIADRIKFREGEAIISRCLSAKVLYQVFPLHDTKRLKDLTASWVKTVWRKQPIDEICNYFGVQIALYFAWLGHYTTALSIPAIVGFLFWFFFYGHEAFLEDIAFVVFAFFNVIWATLYLESWKRRSAELAYTWGTADQRDELLAEPRPQFTGSEQKSEITDKVELYYPAWKRNAFRYFVTVPVIGICLAVVFASVLLILELQQWWDQVIQDNNYMGVLSYGPKVLLAIVIPILDSIYHKVAIWLNDMENYRNATRYENNLVVKKALFQFVNSFLALFYTAFYLQDMDKLKELLAALLITRQVMGNLKEFFIPYLKKEMKLAMLSFDLYGALSPTDKKTDEVVDAPSPPPSKDRIFTQVECESSAPEYEGTFDDYLEMFIQFGYVILFSSAYPLAGLCALLNNLIEIRGDAFKLCMVHRRPFGVRVKSIGSWQNAMELMGLVGVMVNCALIGQSGPVHRIFPNINGTQTILLIIVLEHVMLLLKIWISYAIPDIPSWVATEMAKIEWKRREAEKSTRSYSTTSWSLDMAMEDKEVQASLETVARVEIIHPKLSSSSCCTASTQYDPPLAPLEEEETIVINQIDLDDDERAEMMGRTGARSATPSRKRILNQDEFDRRLKAKRALFTSRGRSLSLFSLPSVRKVIGKSTSKKRSDEEYLEENRAQGELEILGLESLIDVNSLQKQ